MMTSDSDNSDYEDARQHHHVNDVDDSVASAAAAASASNQLSPDVLPSAADNPAGESANRDSPQGQQPQQPDRDQELVDRNNAINDLPAGEEIQVELEQNGYPDQDPPAILNNQDNQALLRHLQGLFAREYPNAIVVDSDEDDVESISDDTDNEMDFPMLNDVDGERGGATSDENEGGGVADVEIDEELQEFDQELPIRHAYLGEGMEELQGRVVLEADATLEIPLIAMGIHLIPGQTLPLTIFHAVFQNAIRRCVMTDRLFGIVHNDFEMPTGNVVYKGALGTLAEIFEYQEESDGIAGDHGHHHRVSMSSSFALKAKGRQRFNVLEVRRQADGNLMGRVRIRPEIKLEPFVLNILLPSTARCHPQKPCEESDTTNDAVVTVTTEPTTMSSPPTPRSRQNSQTSRRDSLASVSISAQSDKDLSTLQSKIQNQRKRTKYYAALTPHPYFVYEHYDETVLVEKMHRLLKTELKGLTESKGKIPTDASDLSFWLAQNLTMDDSHRTKILKLDSPVQRLRYELELLGRTTKVISCRNCQTNIADHSQIFSMSIEGPQGTYVNPHGFVHEALTVYKAKELILRGAPSTEASWFPGYSWTIVECRRCKSHIGWKFQAVGKLKPARFWGLARRSVIFKYDFGSDSDIKESLETQAHRTPPNSANSEAFATVALF